MRFQHITLKKAYWKLNVNYIGSICKLGVSSFVNQLSVVIIMVVTNRLLVYYGGMSKYGAEIPLTALGVTMKINNILLSVMSGIGAGVLPIIGYNYGAGNFDRVKKAMKLSVGSAVVCGAIATVCFQFFPEQIVSIFGTSSDLYMEFGVKCLRVFLALCVLDGLNNVIPTCFQAVGKPGISAVSSLCRQVVFNVPPIIICPMFVGVIGCLWNGPIACALAFVLNLILLRIVMKKLKKEMHVA
jgi:Na+-driven multidrug efflux pump